MSKGKQHAASANRRASQAENDATVWRSRALHAEDEARAYRRGGALAQHRAEVMEAELDKAVRDRDAVTSAKVCELEVELEAAHRRFDRVMELISTRGAIDKIRFSVDELGELRDLLGADLFEDLLEPFLGNRIARRAVRRPGRVVKAIIAETQ
jgi:hypothetical protein